MASSLTKEIKTVFTSCQWRPYQVRIPNCDQWNSTDQSVKLQHRIPDPLGYTGYLTHLSWKYSRWNEIIRFSIIIDSIIRDILEHMPGIQETFQICIAAHYAFWIASVPHEFVLCEIRISQWIFQRIPYHHHGSMGELAMRRTWIQYTNTEKKT